jgi:hypothetical protein
MMENTTAKKVSKSTAEKMAEQKRIHLLARVERTELIKFFQNKSGFASLPGYTNKEIKSREARIRNEPKGWVIPESCFGRKKEAGPTPTMRESIRQWINEHLSHLIPEGSEVFISYENWHEDGPRIVIYRKVMK